MNCPSVSVAHEIMAASKESRYILDWSAKLQQLKVQSWPKKPLI